MHNQSRPEQPLLEEEHNHWQGVSNGTREIISSYIHVSAVAAPGPLVSDIKRLLRYLMPCAS